LKGEKLRAGRRRAPLGGEGVSVWRRTQARVRVRDEQGVAFVLFSVLLPLFLLMGVIAVDVGNWYVHARRLQTLADAGALAAAPSFTGCFHDATAANAAIYQAALKYAGDRNRNSLTMNVQEQEANPGDVHVVLNSSRFWDGNTDPKSPGTNGYGLDTTWTTPPTPGDPCATRSLDVKATDDVVPLLFGFIPVASSPQRRARVEIHSVKGQAGMLPFAVPEVDPAAVFALFVDDDTGNIVDSQQLMENDAYDNDNNPATPFPFTGWTTAAGQEEVCISCNGTSHNTGVVILVSKQNTSPSVTGTLATVCAQSPSLIKCYGGSTPTSGLSFIHAYQEAAAPNRLSPNIRDVNLLAIGCNAQTDLSAPHFTFQGDCTATVRAVIDFGPGVTDPTQYPTCAVVPGYTWSAGGTYGVWTGSVSLVAASGRNTVNIGWSVKDQNTSNSTCKNSDAASGTFNKAAAPYVADDASGPVDYLRLTATTNIPDCATGGFVADANSVSKGKTYCYKVAVGLQPPLRLQPATNDPILLRFASKSGSLNQALDCDHAPYNLEDEVRDGCRTKYAVNYDDFDNDPSTPNTWNDITCSAYGTNDLPPAAFVNDPAPDCVAAKTGDVQAMQKGLHARFETPCTPNYWPPKNATQPQIDDFFLNHDFTNDKRYVTLIITDLTAFTGSGAENVPIKYFAGFYATGWDQGGPWSDGCPDPDGGGPLKGNDCHPLLGCSYQKAKDNGDVWGHFVNFVIFSASGDPSERLCNFNSIATCIPVLVE
jgi:Flp pilus assembly protein TadG